MISVKVIEIKSMKPCLMVRVSLTFNSILRYTAEEKFTNSDGEADFDANPGEGKVWVNNSIQYEGYLEGQIVVFI
jgi:hypothetical protein